MEIGNLFLLMAIKSLGKQPAGPTCESGMLPVGGKPILCFKIKWCEQNQAVMGSRC